MAKKAEKRTREEDSRDKTSAPTKICKVERLRLAGEIAPALRRRVPRKVVLVDNDGNPVRDATDVDVAQGALDRIGIELSVQDGRPRWVCCGYCGKALSVKQYGPCPTRCRECRTRARYGELPDWSSCVDCGSPLKRKTAARLPSRCRKCVYRNYRSRNIEKVRESARERHHRLYKDNPVAREKAKIRAKDWYVNNRERAKARRPNVEKARESQRRYRAKNRERLNARERSRRGHKPKP